MEQTDTFSQALFAAIEEKSHWFEKIGTPFANMNVQVLPKTKISNKERVVICLLHWHKR